MSERLLTARQVAERLGVSTYTVIRWSKEGKLPARKLPDEDGAWRYEPEEIEAWIAARRFKADGAVEECQPPAAPAALSHNTVVNHPALGASAPN